MEYEQYWQQRQQQQQQKRNTGSVIATTASAVLEAAGEVHSVRSATAATAATAAVALRIQSRTQPRSRSWWLEPAVALPAAGVQQCIRWGVGQSVSVGPPGSRNDKGSSSSRPAAVMLPAAAKS